MVDQELEQRATADPRVQIAQSARNIETAGQEKQSSFDVQREILEQQDKATAPKREAVSEAIRTQEANLGQVPEPPKIPTPPKISGFFDKNVGAALLAAGTLIAGIGVGGGKIRGIRAMRSLEGSIKGYIGGNMQAAFMGLEDYRNQIEAQVNEYMLLFQKNRAIIERGGRTIEGRMLDLQLANAPFNNKLLIEAANQRQLDDVIARNMDLSDLAMKLSQQVETANHWAAQIKLRQQELRQKEEQHAQDLGERARYHAGMVAKGGGEHPGDNKPAGPGFYFDKSQGKFVPQIPTKGEIREEPDRYVRTSSEDKKAIEFLHSALDQLPELEAMSKKVLPTGGLLAAPIAGAKAASAAYRSGDSATELQNFKQRASALKLEATRLETGTSRVLGAVLQQVAEQIPQPTTNRDTAVNQIKTLRELINIRLGSFLGTREAGGGGGELRVRRKSDGITGKIPEDEFDPKLYEYVDDK